MSYDIVRLLVHDWHALETAIRARGADFYWERRDEQLAIRMDEIPFVSPYQGPLQNCPARRDPEAGEIYQDLRPHLSPEIREWTDRRFERLFWSESHRPVIDLPEAADTTDIWSALRPATVRALSADLRALDWLALEEGHAGSGPRPWHRCLVSFADFEHHVDNHHVALEFAAKRGLGLIGLVSA